MKDLFRVCPLDDLPEGLGKKIRSGKHIIAVFKYNGRVFALQNACPHQHADLAEGYIQDMKLYCRLHHWAFNLEDGTYAFNPDLRLKTYKVIIDNGIVYLDLNH